MTHETTPANVGSNDRLGLARQVEFAAVCAMLPAKINWGDPLTPELARSIVEATRAAERERCAKLCEAAQPTGGRMWDEAQSACFSALECVAAVIRGPNVRANLDPTA